MKYVTSFERIGIKKGKLEGRQEGSAEVVLRFLRNRFSSLDETVEAQVRALPRNQIEALVDAFPDLDTRADLRLWLLLHSPLPIPEPPATSGSLELDS